MSSNSTASATQLLTELSSGRVRAADRLMPMVYDELHAIAGRQLRRERLGHTLQSTALVHEAYLRLIDESAADWKNRTHFFAVAARAMRQILVEHARRRRASKRRGERLRVTLTEDLAAAGNRDEDVLDVDDALTRLAALDERPARIVELRYFGGLGMEEIAQALGVSKRTVEDDWSFVTVQGLCDGLSPSDK